MGVMRAADIHPAIESRLNAGDVDGIMELYEDGAEMMGEDDAPVGGRDAIRETWALLAGLGGRSTMTKQNVQEVGDLALLRNGWSFESEAYTASAETAEVARRQADGSWRYVIDHPFGASP